MNRRQKPLEQYKENNQAYKRDVAASLQVFLKGFRVLLLLLRLMYCISDLPSQITFMYVLSSPIGLLPKYKYMKNLVWIQENISSSGYPL